MCDTAAYLIADQTEKLIIASIECAVINGNEINITNIFGESVKVSGKITKIDLINNRIEIEGQ